MSHTRSKSKRIFSAQAIAGNATATFNLSDVKHVGMQILMTESCLAVASLVCEDLSLAANSYTEPCHGYETGLKGTLAAVIGCPAAVPIACVALGSACCCPNTFTLACHCLVTGERGRFTTSACDTLPSFCCGCAISACTDYYVINVSASTFKVATSRALALAGTSVCITNTGAGCCVTHTFTPNGAIPTGSIACSWIIKVDDCTFKLATTKIRAQDGCVDPICALNSPASLTFTAACADCTSGTVTVKYSNDSGPCATYLADTEVKVFASAPAILAAGLSVIDADPQAIPYQSMQVVVDVTDSQWVTTIDVNAKN